MMALTAQAALRHALDVIARRAMGSPATSSDYLLCLADAHTEVALDDRLPPALRQEWHASAERLRSIAPVFAGPVLMARAGCTAGEGAE